MKSNNRREFLKKSALASAAAITLPATPKEKKRQLMKSGADSLSPKTMH